MDSYLQYILALFLMTCKFGKTVFLAASYKLIGSRKDQKYEFFHDESIPARPFESEVCSALFCSCCSFEPFCMMECSKCGLISLLCLVSRDDKEPPKLTESGFQFLVSDKELISSPWSYTHTQTISADGYKCTTMVYHQGIHQQLRGICSWGVLPFWCMKVVFPASFNISCDQQMFLFPPKIQFFMLLEPFFNLLMIEFPCKNAAR